MPPGPLPNASRRRRNKPTIPTTELPASGRSDPPPDLPTASDLGVPGREWWAWAWSTPQAAGWSDGDVFMVARRASLEDDIAALSDVHGLDVLELLDAEKENAFRELVRRLCALSGGRLALFREMRELDDRLGLTPKGLAMLRWQIVDDSEQVEDEEGIPLEQMTVKQLRALARERRVALPPSPKKADLIKALELPEVADLDERRRRLTANAP